ncbi:hypothetical protein QM012_008313 [Aureobasidium pullulans]|uniref:tRNA/rRNA methyltransferase SpoU type domain-containing protein n=1 Tax=Aureobasidium pullulans TaxID=5580 RepID=A0ABR0TK37_AURPU
MVAPSVSVHTTLADIFLSRIPESERYSAVRDLASNIDNNTLGLVAALAHQCPDEEANVHLNEFLIRSIEQDDASSAAALCVEYPRIRNALLHWTDRELHICFSQLLRQPKNTEFVVPVDKVLIVDPFVSHYDPELGVDRQLDELVKTTILYLSFAKQLFRSPILDKSFVVSSPIVCAIFGLLAASNAEIAAAAKDTILAFLSSFKAGTFTFSHFKTDPDELDRHLWQCIRNLLDFSERSSYKTTAYTIWLRWLDLDSHGYSRQVALQKDPYWKYLLGTLGQSSQGDTEQRKICLHVLKKSISISRNNIRANDMELTLDEQDKPGSVITESQYARFCTVYETIVIGRYLNQALECVQDLDHLASAETMVQKSWLFALLESALSPVTQDSMRKMLGNWLMSTDIRLFSHAEEFATLLQKSFLPWATQGPLFTGSVQGKTRDMGCAHGTRLSNFLERLLQAHLGRDDVYSRKCIVNAVLVYLDTNKNKIVPVAVIYLLHGLAKGLKGESTACMEGEALELILSLSRVTGYPEVARDAMLVQCYKLSQLISQDAETYGEHGTEKLTASDAKLEVLSQQIEAFKINAPSRFESDAKRAARWTSLDNFLEELDRSQHTSIQGPGLLMACESLTSIFDRAGSNDLDAQKLDRAFDAVWNEVERQDYPRDVLMFLPRLALHPGYVSRCLEHEQLCATVLEVFTQLQRLMKGRIYLWTPIMKAYRTAMITCPASAEKLGLDEFVIQTANNLPAARLEFKLEAAAIQLLTEDGDIHRSYSDYYGEYEEVGHAAFFDLVNRLSNINASMVSEIYDRLLKPWTKQRPPVPIVTKWKSTTQLQVMLMLSEQRLQKISAKEAEDQLRVLLRVVAIEPLPRYRFLLEWMISRVILNHPSTGELVLNALSSKDHHSNPKYLGTLVKIALMIACQDNCSRDFAARVAYRLVALASSAKIIIRHEAQWSFPILWDYAESRGWTEIQSNPACAALNEYIRSLERFSEPPPARELERLDPSADNTLTNLLQGKYLRVEPPGEESVVTGDFERLWEKDTMTKSTSEALPLGLQPSTPTQNGVLPAQATQEQSKESARTEAFAALQTKGTAYLSADLSSSDSTSTSTTRPTSLIVVGSLVDNAYNLGGLSRISEIFGAEAMYIQSPQSVLANKDFVSVAVASHNHLPIHDLHTDNLSAFLTEKKMQGYTVVGVEQTDRSVLLGSEECKLPEKTLLIMGREREGVPANVLGECDMLVEIPQKGVTRSMNVQTAAGVVLFEYARQHQG